MQITNNILYLSGDVVFSTITGLQKELQALKGQSVHSIDLKQVSQIDSAGVAFIDECLLLFREADKLPSLVSVPEEMKASIEIFSSLKVPEVPKDKPMGFFESIGDRIVNATTEFIDALYLASDILYWSIIGVLNHKGQRKGSLVQQCTLIGLDALPIVSLLSFIIGAILSLQSAAQLRNFGANVYIADLLSISLVREMGPLITAIIVAGRSGSAIASEIATMQVTEEIDALKMMAINPLRYIVVPKFHAMTLCMPILVTFSIFVGMLGGLLVAVSYLDLSVVTFVTRSIDILVLKDVVVSLTKSTIFSWLIVIIGSHYGFHVRGGAEGVGRATTISVVASIFAVIVADAIFSLLYL